MRIPEGKRLWLFDLAHGNLKGMPVVQGFIKYYALAGKGTADVVQDIVFRTSYGVDGVQLAKETLARELYEFAAMDFEETRTISEVKAIVAAVRAGHNVQIAYADPDDSFDPLVGIACY
ncbi:MAG: hypothetical protein Q4C59_10290 [Lachnospiraceae bacterium]|nr:hypothetical protein [Lachnospiraceae bacterium]